MLRRLYTLIAVAGVLAWMGYGLSACSKDPTPEEMAGMPVAKLEQLAARENMDAVVELAARYGSGKDVAKDEQKSLELLKRAIVKQHPYGTFLMGVAYATGMGVPKDESEAVVWYQRAADLGDMNGQYWLAFMIGNGRGGIGANWNGAYPMMLKAAMQGHSDARFMLGFMFQSGQGVDQNMEQAATWYRLASETRPNQKAQYNLAGMIENGWVEWKEGDPGQKPLKVTKPLAPAPDKPAVSEGPAHE